jgi:hypothetical protein
MLTYEVLVFPGEPLRTPSTLSRDRLGASPLNYESLLTRRCRISGRGPVA